MHWLTYIGIAVIGIGTLLTIRGQQKIADRSTQLLQDKSNKIELLSSKLSEINQEIAATVTGGDSFCFLFPNPSLGKINTIDFHLLNQGKYPVYDVLIRIWDDSRAESFDYGQILEKHLGFRSKVVTLEEWSKMKEDPKFIAQSKAMEKEIIERMRKRLIYQEKLGTFSPKNGINIMDSPLISHTIPTGIDLNKYSQKYTVDITARNGHYSQSITIKVRNKKYHIYSKVEKVITDSKREIVREYESVDSEGFTIKNLK